MCGCRKPIIRNPKPIPNEVVRSTFPDTPEEQHAFEMDKWGKEQGKEKEEEIDYFNNIDEYTPIKE